MSVQHPVRLRKLITCTVFIIQCTVHIPLIGPSSTPSVLENQSLGRGKSTNARLNHTHVRVVVLAVVAVWDATRAVLWYSTRSVTRAAMVLRADPAGRSASVVHGGGDGAALPTVLRTGVGRWATRDCVALETAGCGVLRLDPSRTEGTARVCHRARVRRKERRR